MGLDIEGGHLWVDNDGTQGGSVTLKIGAEGTLSSDDVDIDPVLPTVNPFTQDTVSVSANDLDSDLFFDWDGGDDNEEIIGTAQSASQVSNIVIEDLPDYIGAGTFEIIAYVDTFFKITGLGGLAGCFTPVTSDGFVKVEYTYTAIPIPHTFLLLFSGLICLLGVSLPRRTHPAHSR